MDRPRGLCRLPRTFAWLFVALFVGLPLLAMFGSTLFDQNGFTLQAWSQVLAEQTDRSKLLYSLQLGGCATLISLLLGGGHAWLTTRTDLPGARLLGPLGITPLILPPIMVAMGFADLGVLDPSGFALCALILGVAYAPFVAVLAGRGLRAIDGRMYEAALLARGRRASEGLLARMILPELLAGCALAFVFVISEHGVPEFLTVKGKAWHTYAEGVFSLWTRRAVGTTHADVVSPVVASLPLLLLVVFGVALALRLRGGSTQPGDFRSLPVRRLGAWRWPALLVPLVYLGCGLLLPLVVMVRWAAGSTQVNEPMSLSVIRDSFQTAITQAGDDLHKTILVGIATALLLILVAVPLARMARHRQWIDIVSVLPIAVPAVLLAMGMVHVFNHPLAGKIYDAASFDFYDSWAMLICAYAARFLPFAVLTLSHNFRRIPNQLEEAALLSGRSGLARAWHVWLPAARPAIWSAMCLIFILALRELDVAVVLTAGNGTVVRRLSNVIHFGGENIGGALALMLVVAAIILPLLTVILTGRKLTSLS